VSTPASETLLIAALTERDVAAMRIAMARAADDGADAAECRLDFLTHAPSDADLRELLTGAPLPVIVTYRPVREGGLYDGAEDRRLACLRRAIELGAAWVDVESDVPHGALPSGRRIVSHHDFNAPPPDLRAAMRGVSWGEVSKLAFASRGPQDALAALDLLRNAPKPAIALAMGEHGLPSRLLCRKFGAFGTYAAVAPGAESAPGQVTLAQMRDLYRWRSIGPQTQVFGVIGCPIAHSMSPAVHNAAFEACGMDAVYVPLRVEKETRDFDALMDAIMDRPWLDWRGLSVTIPHKEHALAYVGKVNCDELCLAIGAVNTITIESRGGRSVNLRGDNTDYLAALNSLCAAMGITKAQLAGRPVAVLGAGGVARAVVAGLASQKADVTIYNRTPRRAEALASEFGARAAGGSPPDDGPEIIVNCTPLGMSPNIDASPLESLPRSARVVFDTIYNPPRTRLLGQAQAAGLTCVSGVDMFVAQAAAQFEIWTSRPAPLPAMREAVVKALHV
jgi:3-dehydroquinate dehydratase/shikimate dehydrogenase